ncbi:MAG TPA: SCO family protein [Hyphomicrobiaceae bacterium]|jgi:protein SCO1/2
MIVRVLALVLLLALPRLASGATAPDLSGVAFEQRPGAQIPLTAQLTDEDGREVQLSDLMAGKPLILTLIYFRCPNICGVARDDLFGALAASGMMPGRDYTLVTLSIDPSETPADARYAKAGMLQRHSIRGAEPHWHFLTGSREALQAIKDAVGFHDRFDSDLKQIIHPVGVVFATPAGVVSSYVLGIGYEPADLRLGASRAAQGTIASAPSPVLLLCFDYDSVTGRYTVAIVKLLRLFAALTVATIAVALYLAFRRERMRG